MSSLMSMRLVSELFTRALNQGQCYHPSHHGLSATYHINRAWRGTTLICHALHSCLSTLLYLLNNRLSASTGMLHGLSPVIGFPITPAATCVALHSHLSHGMPICVYGHRMDGSWQRRLEECREYEKLC
jgi:hypothetical protein